MSNIPAQHARLSEIQEIVIKAEDCLWHVASSIANKSPANRDVEMRKLAEHLKTIRDLSA